MRESCTVCPLRGVASPRRSWSSSQVSGVRDRVGKCGHFVADIYYGKVDHEWAVDIEVAFPDKIDFVWTIKTFILDNILY